MRLRNYRDSDLAAMHAMDQICFRVGIAYTVAELGFYAHHSAVLTLVAEDETGSESSPADLTAGESSFAGFAMVEVVKARRQLAGHVITIDVHPRARRRGVGRSLMAGIEEWLINQGIETCSLEVAVDDAGALIFYEQLSYIVAGRLRGYYMRSLDAYVLRKNLIAAGPGRLRQQTQA